MARRSWRSFDWLLLGALLLLSAWGVTMIYSATINTLGLGNPVQRQMVFVLVGAAVLLLTASVDYRLLELAQHPFPVLVPAVLAVAEAAVLVSRRAEAWQVASEGEAAPLGALLGNGLLPAVGVGVALLVGVYLVDRGWVARLESTLPRLVGAGLVVAVTVAVGVALRRWAPEHVPALDSYLVGAGLAAIYLLDCLTLRFCDILRNTLYVLMLALLGMTLVVGQVAGGAQSWLGAGTVQPSELSKILVIVVLAHFLAEREGGAGRAWSGRPERPPAGLAVSTVVVSLGVVAVPVLLIYLQPDLGTALTLVPVWGVMVWLAGVRFRHLALLMAAGVAALPLAWFGLQDYMRDRLMLFINPAGDPDSYFNVHQALVSIGSGGWWGKGLTHGTQSQLHFLRVRHTDFIFAVTAEELGFFGAVGMLALLLFILMRMLRVAQQSRDMFGRLIVGGVAAVIFFQSLVNVGMNVGLLPVTGIPLPFVSYGGSSLVTLMVGAGLVESVAMRHKKLEFD